MVAAPRDKIAKAILDAGFRPEADIAYQIPEVGKSRRDVSGLHRQHFLDRRTT
jgi:hypothetical protein